MHASSLHLRLAIAALDNLHHCLAEIGRTEGVHERVQPGVYVGHPERGRVQVFWNDFRAGQADVEHEVKGHPTYHIRQHNVGQGDERLSTFV